MIWGRRNVVFVWLEVRMSGGWLCGSVVMPRAPIFPSWLLLPSESPLRSDWQQNGCCPHAHCAQLLSHVWFFGTPRTVARQAPLPLAVLRQEYWSGLPFPSPGCSRYRLWVYIGSILKKRGGHFSLGLFLWENWLVSKSTYRLSPTGLWLDWFLALFLN